MKIIATVAVDLDTSPLGTPARLSEPIDETPVLRRTLERAVRVEGLEAVHVLCPAGQADRVRPLIDGLDVILETHASATPPYRRLVQACRAWGLDGWRGGISSLTVHDEDFDAALVNALAERTAADAVMAIPAAAPLLDPELLSRMIEHYKANQGTARVTIVQAPPGLGAFIIERGVLTETAAAGFPVGALFVYQPTNPAPDITGQAACYRPDAAVVRAQGRLLFDTRRSVQRIKRLLEAGAEDWDAVRISQWLAGDKLAHFDEIPEEIEIELTTHDPHLAASMLRPRAMQDRGMIDSAAIESIAETIRGTDDVRIVLGGFGEPCLHPQFDLICQALRNAGAAAIAVRTSAHPDDPGIEEALFETPVDVIEVMIDAASPDTYRKVHGTDGFACVQARLERWIARRAEHGRPLPLIVPSLVKSNETIGDLEAFVDHWQSRLGNVLVTGYSDCAEQFPARHVTRTTPPLRVPCRRVSSRTLILADGHITTCDQDCGAKQTIGNIAEASLEQHWQSERLNEIRTSTVSTGSPLCASCTEWHRP